MSDKEFLDFIMEEIHCVEEALREKDFDGVSSLLSSLHSSVFGRWSAQ